MICEWDVPFLLTSPRGELPFNAFVELPINDFVFSTGVGMFVLDPSKCESGATLRMARDSIPQSSGSIQHREYVEGVTMKLYGQIMETPDKPACGALLREMWDLLGLHTNALLCELAADEDAVGERRIQWTPTDYGQDRLLEVRMFEEPRYGFDGWSGFSFALHSRYPYAVDQLETTTPISAGGSTTISNPGNCPVYPNVKVYGDTSAFTYTNETMGLAVVYDDSLPGGIEIAGGDYGFFNHFANTAYLNGNQDNLKAGIDITESDFFPLLPGDNLISVSGADIGVIWNAGFRT